MDVNNNIYSYIHASLAGPDDFAARKRLVTTVVPRRISAGMLAEQISGFETMAAVQHLVNTHASTRPTESHVGADRENALVFVAQKLKNPCFKPEE